VSWQARERLRLFALGRSQLREEGALGSVGSYLGGGASYELSEQVSLEGRHVRVRPSTGGAYSLSSIGVTSTLGSGSRAWGDYRLTGGVDGRTSAAVLGLSHQFALGPSWRVQTMVERRKGVAGAAAGDPVLASPFQSREEDHWAAGAGAEFVPEGEAHRLSLRTETRSGSDLSSHLVNLAGEIAFDASLALLTRQEFLQRTQAVSGGERVSRQRSSLWGLAYRPTGHDALNILVKLQWQDAVNPFGGGVLSQDGEETRLVGAAEAIWAPRRELEFGLRLATRATRGTATVLGDSVPGRR